VLYFYTIKLRVFVNTFINTIRNTKIVLYISIVLFLYLFFGIPIYYSNAQIGSDLEIQIVPQFPSAYETVDLSVNSFAIDLNRSRVEWYVDNELQKSGIDETDFQFQIGPSGSVARVKVVVIPVSGSRISRSTVVRPANVDIVWEAHSYTPPFYKGKALAPSRGFVIFSAIPELVTEKGVTLSPENIIYTWRESGITLGNASGYGKQSIVLEGEAVSLQPMSISVTATSFDGALEAHKSVQVRISDPEIVFYEKHPLEGILYEHALSDTATLEGEEITLRAEPYFFSLDDMAEEQLEYVWRVNDKTVLPVGQKVNEITLRREGGETGTANVSLYIENNNLDKILQEAATTLLINLGVSTRF
jgi:hypothetical protein